MINFPTSLDSLPNPTGTDLLENATLGLDHDQQHSNANDAIEALEAKVGINSSAVTTSHDYKLSAVTGSAKALTSGTSTQSVTGLTLVSPTLSLTSDATGDIYYRNSGGALTRLPIGTTGQILDVSASGIPEWISNPGASDASTTVKGVVEIATQAEINAGTATGGTGAALVVTPDQLALSNYLSTSSTAVKVGATYLAGESITAGQPVSTYFYQSDGGILFDAKTTNNGSVTSAGGTVTFSHTVANQSNRMLVLYVSVGAASGTVPTPTVTYNGVSMSAVQTQAASSSDKLFSFSLAAPSTGANNIVITLGASAQTNYVSSAVTTYYNVSALENNVGTTGTTVAYGIPAPGVLLSSGSSRNAGTASVNNNNNFQDTGDNSFARCVSGDSGIAFTKSSATVTYGGSMTNITVIGLTPTTTPVYGYVVKSSAATPPNAVNLNKYTTFTGFAQSSVSTGASINVTTDAGVTGLSSLTPLATYYLADTAGTISTTAGTNSKKVGLATSTTTLLLKDTI